jgi:hypothetical protein
MPYQFVSTRHSNGAYGRDLTVEILGRMDEDVLESLKLL